MGLYAENPTILSVVAHTADMRTRIESQLLLISRTLHAQPQPWGAKLAATILADPTIYRNWSMEIRAMAERLRTIREKLFDQLQNRLKTPGNWHYIRKSQGMFCTVLLSPEQLTMLTERERIHLYPGGHFSLGCMNALKIQHLARAIDHVVKRPEGIEPAAAIYERVRRASQAAQAAAAAELARRAAENAAANLPVPPALPRPPPIPSATHTTIRVPPPAPMMTPRRIPPISVSVRLKDSSPPTAAAPPAPRPTSRNGSLGPNGSIVTASTTAAPLVLPLPPLPGPPSQPADAANGEALLTEDDEVMRQAAAELDRALQQTFGEASRTIVAS